MKNLKEILININKDLEKIGEYKGFNISPYTCNVYSNSNVHGADGTLKIEKIKEIFKKYGINMRLRGLSSEQGVKNLDFEICE